MFSLASVSKIAFAQPVLKIPTTGINPDRNFICQVAAVEDAVIFV